MNLKFYRKKNGLNQTQIANLLNCTQQNYANFENGKSLLNTNQVIKLCRIYRITPNELFGILEPDSDPIQFK